ncbi:hypothetical protein N7512_007643 [Penicillium capsulatum]|nr:hypothetical protein N7512_007643 [Penicillium capsulatum]
MTYSPRLDEVAEGRWTGAVHEKCAVLTYRSAESTPEIDHLLNGAGVEMFLDQNKKLQRNDPRTPPTVRGEDGRAHSRRQDIDHQWPLVETTKAAPEGELVLQPDGGGPEHLGTEVAHCMPASENMLRRMQKTIQTNAITPQAAYSTALRSQLSSP